ncbi:DUF3784 domain-containing protein [Christensenellaceae bacterium OttesenSCG-928-K19]|nr:DUF3784 domain-containing protein [Christensenellaceae bacterium OttesenSCG-928-K19]
MDTVTIALSVITLLLAAASFVIAYRQSKERGFVFNNSYLYASKEERERRDWAPEYKQSKTAFFILGLMFSILTLKIIIKWDWLTFVVVGIAVVLVVYAIASSLNGIKNKSI